MSDDVADRRQILRLRVASRMDDELLAFRIRARNQAQEVADALFDRSSAGTDAGDWDVVMRAVAAGLTYIGMTERGAELEAAADRASLRAGTPQLDAPHSDD